MLNKKRETRQVADRGSSKLRKIEGNVKITSNRLTIPPGYLTLGISSETFQKDKDKDTDCKRSEDLQGLFSKCLNVNSISVRRSERILKKNIAHEGENSFGFVHDLPGQFFTNCKNVEIDGTARAKLEKPIWRNRSKSLFREINEKYVAKTSYFNNFSILTPPQENTSVYSGPEAKYLIHNPNFCQNLAKQLLRNNSDRTLAACRSKILLKINEINSVLAGKTVSRPKMSAKLQFPSNSFRNDTETNFKYYPPSQWVYETPPRQKLILPKLEECEIHPAILYSNDKDTNIYEFNSKVNIDLSTYASGRRINFDRRFLSHVGTFQHNEDIDTSCHRKTNHRVKQVEDSDCACLTESVSQEKSMFNFTKPNPFIGLISRPRKTEKVSRLKNILKRKLDTPNDYEESYELLASGSQSQDMFGNSYPSKKEDLQLTNFEFKKKLFCDDRGSDINKPNLFDFSQ